LSIGTARFGVGYGLFSESSRINDEQLAEIFSVAKQHGVKHVDTSIMYGDAEARLGSLHLQNMLITSKVWAPTTREEAQKIDFFLQIEKTLKRLKANKIHAVLIHNAHEIEPELFVILISKLRLLKEKNLVKKIGVSCYEADQAIQIINAVDIDILQVPGNIFDRRLVNSGLLALCNKREIEVHVRSIFLGGLLMRSTNQIPIIFNQWKKLLDHWQDWLSHEKITQLQANMAFARYLLEEGASKIIVGVGSTEELLGILQSKDLLLSNWPTSLISEDRKLINPYNWQ
jgi:aryl-alcohol dehydrogenase-like predicted oxidoreductase